MDKNALNTDKKYSKNQGELGFTLIEVIVAVAILAFSIFATWRVITSSINSITRQGKRIKALHIGQACLGRLEGEAFLRVVPENFAVPSSGEYELKAINDGEQLWDKDGNGVHNIDDFEVRANKTGTWDDITSSCSYSNLKITIPSDYEGKPAYIDYRYYHLIDEGGTIPSSDGEGRKKHIIRLVTNPPNKSDIIIEKIANPGTYITSSDFTYDPNTRNLEFTNNLDEGEGVWIYYLPERATTDANSDGYEDPSDDSIVGVVEGSFWDSGLGVTTTAITPTKHITVTEFWKQEGEIKSVKIETFIQR